MSDYFDRLAAELVRAAKAAPPAQPATPWRRLSLGRGRRRAALIAGALAVVAAPALAVTRPWNPAPQQIVAEKGAKPTASVPTASVAVTSASPPTAQLSLLAVLRRAPSAVDQSPQVASALRQLFGGITGIEINYVRVLYDVPGKPLVLLIPAQSWSGRSGPGLLLRYRSTVCCRRARVRQGKRGQLRVDKRPHRRSHYRQSRYL